MRVLATFALTLGLPLFPGLAFAQTPNDDTARAKEIQQAGAPAARPAVNDSLFRRAEQMVREGKGDVGRALVDTLLAGTRAGSLQHAQALYWRASLAGDAAEAERGYRRVIVEYPVTRYAGDALLNLAQLEMARGEQDEAIVHLYRFEREHSSHDSRARASLWLARLHFDKKNDARGCAALATARVAASPEDVELRNQIEYYGQRCIGVDTSAAPTTAQPAASARPAPATPSPTPPPAKPIATTPAPAKAPTHVDSAARDHTAGGYTVQVAAYDTQAAAEALIVRLKARGYTARLASSARPFRVRIGRYDTRAEAVTAQQRLKVKGIEGFVTEMERP